MLTYVQGAVVGTITQGLLYGIYLATLIQCFRWLIFTDEGWKPREKINSFAMAFGTIFIFVMTTTNIITTLGSTIQILRGDEAQMYGMGIAMSTSEALAVILIDGMLIYRCWIVYGKSWRVICVPVTFWFGSLACSALASYYWTLSQNTIQIDEMVITGVYACNITTTIYTTTAIIYRIWYIRKASSGNPKRLDYVVRILAESGALYCATTIFSLVGSARSSGNDLTWVDYLIGTVSDAINFSMAGISFNLLLIRVNQSRIEQRDSLAESRNDDGVRTLSGMQFNNPQIAVSSEGPPNERRVEQMIDEIREHRRSSDGMHAIVN